MRRSWLVAPFALLTSCGPAEPSAKVPAPPAPSASAKPAEAPKPPPLARWSFPNAAFEPSGRPLDLGEGRMLYAGHSGRRALRSKEGVYQEAGTLLPEAIESMTRDAQGRIAFLGRKGSIWIAHEPLGPVVELRKSPKPFVSASAGKSAMVGIDATGAMFRSTDQGVTWSPVASPYKGPGLLFDVGLDADGHGLAIAAPQRAFVTVDDGSTWSPIPTPSIGMYDVEHDARGSLFLMGVHLAKLEGTPPKLVAEAKRQTLTDLPTPALQSVLSVDQMGVVGRFVWAVGPGKDGVVLFAHTPMGAPFQGAIALPDECENRQVLGQGDSELHLLCSGETTRLFRLVSGKTWTQEASGPGDVTSGAPTLLGPGGWTLSGDMCQTGTCGPFVRLAGSKVFEPIELDAASKGEVLAATADDKGRVLLLTRTNSRVVLSEGTTTTKSFHRLPLLDLTDVDLNAARLFVASDGTLSVVTLHGDRAVLRTFKDGKPLSTKDLPGFHEVVLADRHGLGLQGDNAWETADGGDSWFRVGSGDGGSLSCNTEGCVVGEAVRGGWDLPGLPRLEALTSDEAGPAPPFTNYKSLGMGATCRMVGPWNAQSLAPPANSAIDLPGNVHWASVKRLDNGSARALFARGAGKPQELELLAAEKADKTRRTRTVIEGFAALRISYETKKEDGKLNPVDLELGWFAPKSGKVGKAKLPNAGTFRVSSFGTGGIVVSALDDDLVVSLPGGQRHLVHPNGKLEALPKLGGTQSLGRVGKQIVSADGFAQRTRLTWDAKDARVWRILPPTFGGGSFTLTQGDGAMLAGWAVSGARRELWAFPLTEATADPPEPWIVDVEALMQKGVFGAACDEKSLAAPRAWIPIGQRKLRIGIEGAGTLTALTDSMAVHFTGKDKACIGAWSASGDGVRVVVPANDPKHATVFSNTLWASRTLDCK